MPPVPRRKPPAQTVTPDTSDTAAPRRSPRTGSDGPGAATGGPGPRAATPGDTPRATPRTTTGPRAPLQRSLEELFSAPAYVYAVSGDSWAEEHINTTAPRLAEAWYKLAQKNPAVKRTLESLTTGSAWGGVALATGATVLPLLAHHQVLPARAQVFFAGVPTTGDGSSGPIVPPPPPPSTAGVPPAPGGGGTPRSPRGPVVPPPGGGMTAPLAPDSPPGVVTVAASNNRAVMLDGS